MIPYFVLDQIVLGPVKLYTWGLFVGLGFSAGYSWFYYLAKREGLAPKKIVPLCGSIFFGAMLGAWFWARLTAGGGAAFMGGLIGAIASGVLYVRLAKLGLWRVADLLVLPTLLGIAIGRVGCILINDHQGAPTSLPWGILWPDGISRHPVAIYEMLMVLGLLGVFWYIRKELFYFSSESRGSGRVEKLKEQALDFASLRSNNKNGALFLLFLLSYSFFRFFLDFTRAASGPLADPRWGILSVSQWVAGIIFLLSLALFIYKRKC